MNNIKISNELLSWVLGCECEFDKIENNFVDFVVIRGKIEDGISSYFYKGYDADGINLHTFIDFAKIKIFNKNYLISPIMDGFVIFDLARGEPSKQIGAGKRHKLGSLEQKLKCLEWVANKIGGEE